jgi:hypothetical protein
MLLAVCAIAARAESTATAGPPDRNLKMTGLDRSDERAQSHSKNGQIAQSIKPKKWRVGETDNFIIHYRRQTEVRKVAREVEHYLWFIAKNLNVGPEGYARKSHVFVFEDEDEWKEFLEQTDALQFAASFAQGDELFLNVRGRRFNSSLLAHETTHAVVSRIYPRTRWPLWLNEGFAEYMGGAAVANRLKRTAKGQQKHLSHATLTLEQMFALKSYPSGDSVHAFYQTAEKFVRYLFNKLPQERFVKFADAVAAGCDPKEVLLEVYGDKIKDWKTFERRYARFTK